MPRYLIADPQDESGEFIPGASFATPQDAATYVKAQRAVLGRALRIVPDVPDEDVRRGRDRESARFHDGTYTRLPSWFPQASQHYAHFALDSDKADQGFVAYTPTRVHAAQDRQVVLSASRYLSKLDRGLSADEIAALHQRLVASRKPATYAITRDRATVREAYVTRQCAESSDYPSCMAHTPRHFGLSFHPAEAYVADGATFSLAYGKNDAGAFVSRAVVSEGSKTFVRVYGVEESDKLALARWLEEQGFARAEGFSGERIAMIDHPRGGYVVPYMDGDTKTCDEDGLIDEDGSFDLEVTGGRAEGVSRFTCDHCGDGADEDGAFEVQGEMWCSHCAENNAIYCQRYGGRFAEDGVEVVYRRGWSETWCEDAANAHAFYCERTERHYSEDYYTQIEVQTASGIQTWCEEETTRWHREDDNGAYWCEADFPEEDEDEDDAQEDAAPSPAPALPPGHATVRITRTNYSFADEIVGRTYEAAISGGLAAIVVDHPHGGYPAGRRWSFGPAEYQLVA